MSESLIYEGAMQVVPLLLIALFIDNRPNQPEPRGRVAQGLVRFQDRAIAVLCFVSFFISMFVLGGAVPVSGFTTAVVIAALSGSIGLLFSTIWRRFAATAGNRTTTLQPAPRTEEHHDPSS